MRPALGALPVALLWALPLGLSLLVVLQSGFAAAAWSALLRHPQLWPALALSLWTGTAAALAALAASLVIAAAFYRRPVWRHLAAWAGAGLALPHLAFAIGFAFLVMPSGLLARIVVGGEAPPPWITVQDPLGLSLIAALALKEVPFFLVMIWSVLASADAAVRFEGQWRAARSLGHGPGSVWLRVVQPQLLRALAWPIVIVWVYGATVVDMALVLGPTQPPTLALVVWRDVNDGDAAMNDRGLAGAILLSAALALSAIVLWALARWSGRRLGPALTAGPAPLRQPRLAGWLMLGLVGIAHLGVVLLLAAISASARWPYPDLWPGPWTLAALRQVLEQSSALSLSLGLAAATSLAALGLAVLWFETQPPPRDRLLLVAAVAALGLPQLVVAVGQYRLLLGAGLAGTLSGLFLVHLTPVFAYVAIVLVGPYRALDRRYLSVARSLGAAPFRRWWRVSAPLLRGPLLMAGAVGFSVSMVQFVPAQLMAAGRFATLPMEAVTRAAGGSRPLLAADALLLALPPLLAFALAARWGRRRWR